MKIIKKYDKDTYFEYDSHDINKYYPSSWGDCFRATLIQGICAAIFFGFIELLNYLSRLF